MAGQQPKDSVLSGSGIAPPVSASRVHEGLFFVTAACI
jgi:hypothetical protein